MSTAETTSTQSTTPAMAPDLAEALEDAGFPASVLAEAPSREAPLRKDMEQPGPEATAEGDDAEPAAAKAKGGDEETEGDKPTDEEAAKAKELEDDAKELAAIRKRNAERRRARETTREAPAAKKDEVAAAPAEKPKAEAKPAEKAQPTRDEADIAKLVSDVFAEIAKMKAEEEAAPGGSDKETAAEADKERAARREKLAALETRIEDLKALLGKGAEAQSKIDRLTQLVEEQHNRQAVMEAIEAKIDKLAGEAPTLAARRDATRLVYRAAENHLKKHGKVPEFGFVVRKIEAVLARRESRGESAPEGATEEKPNGKETSSKSPRKTVSSTTATPPAKRKGPDTRDSKSVVKDAFSALGIPEDYE